MNNAPLNQLLYQTVGSSFTISCQGSGQLLWNGPGGININSFTSSNVYQSTGNLHLSSFNVTTNGIYTCSSSLGATEIIMITNGIYDYIRIVHTLYRLFFQSILRSTLQLLISE